MKTSNPKAGVLAFFFVYIDTGCVGEQVSSDTPVIFGRTLVDTPFRELVASAFFVHDRP